MTLAFLAENRAVLRSRTKSLAGITTEPQRLIKFLFTKPD
jgi:hypothetical protein